MYWPLLFSNQNPIFLIDHSNSWSPVLQIWESLNSLVLSFLTASNDIWNILNLDLADQVSSQCLHCSRRSQNIILRRRSCWWVCTQWKAAELAESQAGMFAAGWQTCRAPISTAGSAHVGQGNELQLMCLQRKRLLPVCCSQLSWEWLPKIRPCCSSAPK